MAGETVLVTGGSGFLGAHCVAQLLEQGFSVRTTVRNDDKKAQLIETLDGAGVPIKGRLGFSIANLNEDEGWAEAVKNCTYVLHTASPFPAGTPSDENELIAPARDGTLRVLRAAKAEGVKRVVLTSSFPAIGYGHPPGRTRAYTEKDWSNLEGDLQPYTKSKTVAERAAWDYVEGEGEGLELTVINPVGIFGPPIGAVYGTSLTLVNQLINGGMPMLPNISFGAVDVRDVAALHIKAMTSEHADGERFIANAGTLSFAEAAEYIKDNLGPDGNRISTSTIPDFVIRFMALFNAQAKQVASELGKMRDADARKARTMLDWKPRSAEEALLASARALVILNKMKKAA